MHGGTPPPACFFLSFGDIKHFTAFGLAWNSTRYRENHAPSGSRWALLGSRRLRAITDGVPVWMTRYMFTLTIYRVRGSPLLPFFLLFSETISFRDPSFTLQIHLKASFSVKLLLTPSPPPGRPRPWAPCALTEYSPTRFHLQAGRQGSPLEPSNPA